ncbi:MAG: hypothetical protein HC767_15850 [Akkermansiaceae bacterium]|nr:hypothetical protein [Akkermansiaceae bacterium]
MHFFHDCFIFPATRCSLQLTLSAQMIPTPTQIFASFERGEIEREEMHALMALHARELIHEMEEDYQNPAAALIETLLARRAIGKLVRQHGGRIVREVLVALSAAPDFPPARHLWNASHPDVPLHCFLRIRREPVFRMISIEHKNGDIQVVTEHGPAAKGKATRRTFLLTRVNYILSFREMA